MKLTVSYEIEFPDSDKGRLLKLAEETGNTFGDAGPLLSIRRTLIDLGISECFPEHRQLNMEYWIKN